MTEFALVVARSVHVGATMLLFGEMLFAFALAELTGRIGNGGIEARVRTHIAWALVLSAVAWTLWLAIEAASMAGTSLRQALDVSAMMLVLRESAFGHLWCVRVALLAILAVAWSSTIRRATAGAWQRKGTLVALALAAIYLATLAFAGHPTAATQGAWRAAHLASDASHALAAGAWLGALPALVMFLRSGQPDAILARGTHLFSVLGITSVSVLLASGIVNAWFLVGSLPGLFGTPYGQLLIVKIAVFALMLSIAAVNRWSLATRLSNNDVAAVSLLRRNAALEIFGGILIVVIVGALGTMVPAAHQSVVWPFPFTVDSSLAEVGRDGRLVLGISAGVGVAALVLIVSGLRRVKPRSSTTGAIGLVIATVASIRVLAIPAFPTTYAMSPVPYRVDEVARGAANFARDCSGCHGADARGDGPLAASLSNKPANLAERVPSHPEGNLFWWIAHGIPSSGMPPFSPRLSDTEIWQIVEWLKARSAAEGASGLGPKLDSESQFRVPDFDYEVPQQGQQTLLHHSTSALVVLYALPQSLGRLMLLGSDDRLVRANIRVIAIPMGPTQRADAANSLLRTVTSPSAASVYAMFAGTLQGSEFAHVELLIDGAGVLRARWTGLPSPSSDQTAAVLAQAERLGREPTASAHPSHHMH